MTLDAQLRQLGDELALDGDHLVDDVLAAIDTTASSAAAPRQNRRRLAAAAAILLISIGVVAAIPSSRRAVADWFGFGAVTVQPAPSDAVPPSLPSPVNEVPGTTFPGVEDGVEDVVFTEFVGDLRGVGVDKLIGADTEVTQVRVGDAFGIWIEGAPHEMVFVDQDEGVIVRRFAGNTLLWQAGDVVRRLEGMPDVNAAVEWALAVTPPGT